MILKKKINKYYLAMAVILTFLFSCQNKSIYLSELNKRENGLQKSLSDSRKLTSQSIAKALNLQQPGTQRSGRQIASRPRKIEYVPTQDSDNYFNEIIKKRKKR